MILFIDNLLYNMLYEKNCFMLLFTCNISERQLNNKFFHS